MGEPAWPKRDKTSGEFMAVKSQERPQGTLSGTKMQKPALIDIVRRAYALWEQAGRPEGRDQEFYLEAERELLLQQPPGDIREGS